MQTVDILGKKYNIRSGLSSDEIEKINKDIDSRLKNFAIEYPDIDKIDMLVLYIIELKESIAGMEKDIQKHLAKLEKTRYKIISLEKKLAGYIENLDKT